MNTSQSGTESEADPAVSDNAKASKKAPKRPPIAKADVSMGIFLLVESLIVVVVFGYVVSLSAQDVNRESVVGWQVPAGARLQTGPANYLYDVDAHQIRYRGTIDADSRSVLLELLTFTNETSDTGNDRVNQQAIQAQYEAAIDKLAFLANRPLQTPVWQLLALGALAGLVGVQTRSMTSFILHASVTGDLEIAQWWPWYIIRQPIGLALGGLLVVLVKSDLIVPAGGSNQESLWWWLAMSALVGFAALEFADRLRAMAKALFGMKAEQPQQ